MKEKNTFLFVRHGETDYNRLGVRCGGDVDIPLNAHGEAQAHEVAAKLAGRGIGVIVTSPLERTQRTAAVIAAALGGLNVITEPLFLERRLGEWNGRPIAATEPLLRNKQTPPGGESEQDFRGRIERALRVLRPHLENRPLVVSSKGVARMVALICGDTSQSPAKNAEIFEFRLPD